MGILDNSGISAASPGTGIAGQAQSVLASQAQQRALQASAVQMQPQIASAVRSGNYAQAWKIASANPVAMMYLTNPQAVASMSGGSFSPQQTQAFYSAAVPYASQLVTGGQMVDMNHTFNSGGDQAKSIANVSSQLQQLASGKLDWGSTPNIGRIAGNNTAGGLGGFLDKAVPIALVSAVAAGTGGALAPVIGPVGAGAVAGGVGSALNSGVNGTPLTFKSIGTGAAMGALGGAANQYLQPAAGALSNAGVNPIVSGALTRGAVGAGLGALGSKITGGNVGNGALVGGVGGAASGAIGAASGSNGLGQVGGTIAGTLAGKYLTTPTAAKPPALPGAPAPGAQPSGVLPTLPGSVQNTGSNASPVQNIGSYSGYGYAPRQQVANPVADYSTYGQGPEAQFYQNTGPAPTPPTTTQSTQTPQPMMGVPGGINRKVSG